MVTSKSLTTASVAGDLFRTFWTINRFLRAFLCYNGFIWCSTSFNQVLTLDSSLLGMKECYMCPTPGRPGVCDDSLKCTAYDGAPCYKITSPLPNGDTRTLKGCLERRPRSLPNDVDSCTKENINRLPGQICYCSTNLCNSATSSHNSFSFFHKTDNKPHQRLLASLLSISCLFLLLLSSFFVLPNNCCPFLLISS